MAEFHPAVPTPTPPEPQPTSEKDKEVGVELPTLETILPIVKNHSSALQFKNSLKYIQGGTNMTLDRMIARFDILLGEIYLEGVKDGLNYAKAIVETKSA